MIQLYQTSSYIEKFTIYGERHSGTSFLEECIKQTFGLDVTYFYGFKHWFGFIRPEIKELIDNNIDWSVEEPLGFFKE